jgi:hypothetical protein
MTTPPAADTAPMSTMTSPQPRVALMRRRELRVAWLCLLFGLVIPFLALIGARQGWKWHEKGVSNQLPLVIGGLVIFAVRLGLYLT